MSVKERVQKADVRPVIDNLFPKPEFDLTADLKAPAQTENYAEMGAAFNYVFTFWLASNHGNADIVRWPTRAGLNAIESDYPQHATTAHARVDAAEEALAAHIDTGDVTEPLCLAALDLARIEAAYNGDRPRALHLLRRLGDSDEGDLADLKELYNLIPDDFTDYQSITVNPDFGPVEVQVGGVDVDVVCDGTLLDIKTTKDLSLKVNYWRKLVAYATLADAAQRFGQRFGEHETTVPEITRVGLYFSRHGVLWTTPADQIYNHTKYDEFKDWFINVATN